MASAFDNILNFRDVAEEINHTRSNRILEPGRLYRSARPDAASASDKQRLKDQFGITTIIDLRSKTEHMEAAQKLSKSVPLAKSAAVFTSNTQVAQAVRIPTLRYEEINLNGKGFERHLVWQLSYGNIACLAGYMLFGYRLRGISIIGKNVLQPRGLVGLGMDTLQHSGPEIKEVFDVLADPESYPVLVHCTQGKDRTGLIVVLVLLLCGVKLDAITTDYVRSERDLESEFDERMKEIASIGLDESFARCPSTFVQQIADFINARYGGIEAYLSHIGIQPEKIHTLRSQMVK